MNPNRLFQSLAVAFILTATVPAAFAARSPQAQSAIVDVNNASEKDLEALPGIGAATAKKIIAARPYSSVADLSRAGVSAKTMDKIRGMVTAGGMGASAARTPMPGASPRTAPSSSPRANPAPAVSGMSVDLNTASQQDLEKLPAIGFITARKIIAGRPYNSVDDLSRAGVSANAIAKIRGLVTVSAPAQTSRTVPPRSPRANPAPEASGVPVDLNTASPHDLEKLPAIGFITARKIVAGRPYSSVDDLSRAGVSASAIAKIRGLVTVSAPARTTTTSTPAAPAPRTAPPAPQTADDRSVPTPAPASRPASSTTVAPPSGSGMVWVNKNTKVFHRQGDHWYGNTTNGAYMTEQDAINAGYRESKQKIKPQ